MIEAGRLDVSEGQNYTYRAVGLKSIRMGDTS